MNLRVGLALLAMLAVTATGCRRAPGPRLYLPSPPGVSPNFGDAPNRAAESMQRGGVGGGGGGTYSSEDPALGQGSGGGSGPGVPSIIGGAIGMGALGAAAAAGKIQCKPGERQDSEGVVNLCSGERRAAPPKPGE